MSVAFDEEEEDGGSDDFNRTYCCKNNRTPLFKNIPLDEIRRMSKGGINLKSETLNWKVKK